MRDQIDTSGRQPLHWSATDAIARGQGVCRDRAHAVVALCRAFNMPARYAVSYLPDIEVADDGIPPDFHAYAEVWLEGGWYLFDPHDGFPRKGRVFLASGLDAADAAFATLYGGARLVHFKVRADHVRLTADGPVLDCPTDAAPAATPSAPVDGATATPAPSPLDVPAPSPAFAVA